MTRVVLLLGFLLLIVACNDEANNSGRTSKESTDANHGDTMNTLTVEQAGDRAEKHVHHAVAALPVDPTLTPKYADSVECFDPTDNGPRGRYQVARKYWLDNIPRDRNTEFIDALHDYWSSNGYRILTDKRSSSDKFVSVEHRDDAFVMSVKESVEGDLSLGASSPCVWPDGVPTSRGE